MTVNGPSNTTRTRSTSSRRTHRSYSAQNNDEVKATSPCCPTRKLNSYGRPHIRPLRVDSARDVLHCRFGNDVKQDFTYLPGSGSDCVALLILKSVNPSAFVQRENLWFSKHVRFLVRVFKRDLRHPGANAEGAGRITCHYDLKRFLTAPAIPTRPVPRSNIVVGSGTGLLVICP